MTNLTEQLKKGELKLGEHYYYTTIFSPTVYIQNFTRDVISFQDFKETVAEVLDKVPSYEQWQAKLEENTKLKEQLKECELWFTGVVGNMNDKNCGEHNRNLPIGNFEHIFKVFSQKINQVLGDKTDVQD
jgi:hypothetical protein